MSVVFRCLMIFVLLGAPVWAQESGTAETSGGSNAEPADGANTDGLSLGIPEIKVGQTYSDGTHGDWEVRCVKAAEGNDPCQLYQLLKDEQGNSVAEINLFNLPEEGPAVAGATVITPLETLLTEPMRLAVDGGQARMYPYRFCAQVGAQRHGCIARLGFTADEIENFKKGSAANVIIHAAGKPQEPVNLRLSLSGFTAGWGDISARNAPTE